MAYRKPLTDEAGEVREWTKEDFAGAVPFSQLPKSLQAKLRSLKKPRGPQKAPTKEVVTICLSRDVVERLRGGLAYPLQRSRSRWAT